MKCPHCKKEIDYANYEETNTGWASFGKMAKNGRVILEDWEVDETDRDMNFCCPACGEDITHKVQIQ